MRIAIGEQHRHERTEHGEPSRVEFRRQAIGRCRHEAPIAELGPGVVRAGELVEYLRVRRAPLHSVELQHSP